MYSEYVFCLGPMVKPESSGVSIIGIALCMQYMYRVYSIIEPYVSFSIQSTRGVRTPTAVRCSLCDEIDFISADLLLDGMRTGKKEESSQS